MLCNSTMLAVDRDDTATQYFWMCPGVHPEIGGRDAFCSSDKPACPWAAPVVENTCLR